MSVPESHLCHTCEEPANRRCAGCFRVWYCSKACQTEFWPIHIFDCKVDKPIKTSYYLARAARADLLPDHTETLRDYGFDRLFTNTDRTKLFGLYVGLFLYLRASPRDVHHWRVNGTLVKEIKAAFEKIPVHARGDYYPWFLRNQYVLDHSLPLPATDDDRTRDVIMRAWRFTGGSTACSVTQITEAISNLPNSRQICHELYRSLLVDSMSHPSPLLSSWLMFGFCTCRNFYEESSLGALYQQLIRQCTFDQFAVAYESGELIKLMDSKGFQSHRQIVDLEDVLGTVGFNKSVWDLKQLVEVPSDDDVFRPPPSVLVDYGFANCVNETEFADLKALYKQVLDMPEANPLDLHEAAIQGKLFEFVARFVKLKKNAAKRLKRLLKNPYPLKF